MLKTGHYDHNASQDEIDLFFETKDPSAEFLIIRISDSENVSILTVSPLDTSSHKEIIGLALTGIGQVIATTEHYSAKDDQETKVH